MSTEVAFLPDPLTIDVFVDPTKANDLIAEVEERARTLAKAEDPATIGGRTALASIAYRVARSKTALDKLRKEATEDLRKKVTQVNAAGTGMVNRLEALQAEVRKPVTDWEVKDEERKKVRNDRIEEIAKLRDNIGGASVATASLKLADLMVLADPTFDWQEFRERAMKEGDFSRAQIQAAHDAAARHEKEQAELEALRAEKAQRDAQEAERKRREDEQRATEDRKLRDEQIAQQARLAAEEAAESARLLAEQAATRRERTAQEAREKAESDLREAQERAKAAEQAAVAREARAREEAAVAERRWQEEKAEAQRLADAKRAADEDTTRKVHRAMKEAFMESCGHDEVTAKAVVIAIARGWIPNTKITY